MKHWAWWFLNTHYQPSERSWPTSIPDWDYPDDYEVRKANATGHISYKHRRYQAGAGFVGKRVGLKPTNNDHERDVYFRQFYIKTINLKDDIIGG